MRAYIAIGLLGLVICLGVAGTELGQNPQVGIPLGGGIDLSSANQEKHRFGTTLPASCETGELFFKTDAATGESVHVCTAADTWTRQGGSGGSGIPSGAILLVSSGACPAGFSEEPGLSGKFLLGTVAANNDIGTTGGADTVTPAGTVSQPAFSGNAVTSSSDSAGTPAGTVSQPIFTGTEGQDTSSVSGGTPAGTVSQPVFTGNAMTGHQHGAGSYANTAVSAGTPAGSIDAHTVGAKAGTSGGNVSFTAPATHTFTGSALAAHNHAFSGSSESVSAGTPSGTVSQPSFSGSALATHSHSITPSGTVSQPAFTGSALAAHGHTVTATGTVSQPAFTGSSFDNRPAFVKVIFCKKTS